MRSKVTGEDTITHTYSQHCCEWVAVLEYEYSVMDEYKACSPFLFRLDVAGYGCQ